MSAVSITAARPQFGIARLTAWVTCRPLLAAIALTALLTALRLSGTVDSDVAWQLWIAGRIHAGARLYRDIIEVNPPLWFWLALPLDSAATHFHARIESVLAVAIGGMVMLSLAATERLLSALTTERRTLLLSYSAILLLGLPWVHLGQREQIVLIGALPYAALVAARRDRRSVSRSVAFLVGAGAAIGFALKHYFLIAPAALELWLLAEQRRTWCWRRPEVLALLAVGALYAAAILLWASDFLTKVVPLIRLSYGLLGAISLRQLFGPFAAFGLFTLGITSCLVRPLSSKAPSLSSALLVASSAFAVGYFIQSKGWIYHSIPLLGSASLALAAFLAESGAATRLVRLGAPALLALPLVLATEEQTIRPNADLQGAVSGLEPGETAGFLTAETALPWSVTLQHRLHYPSRYMGFWMMNAIVRNELLGNPNPRLAALGLQIVSQTADDFSCTPPKRIIVSRPRPGDRGFDILPFFLRDPRFADLLSHYKVRSRSSLETYELASPLARPTFPCRTGI